MPQGRSQTAPVGLAALRRRVGELERQARALEREQPGPVLPWRFALEPLDHALPQDGLAPDGVHEAAGVRHMDAAAAAGFLAALLRRLERRDGRDTVLVCQDPAAAGRYGRPYGPGWVTLGHDPQRFVIARPARTRDVPWIVEQGLRSASLAAVVAETGRIGFTASRRLSMAAREGHTPALLLCLDGIETASAAATRWHVTSLPGAADPFDARAFAAPRWRLDLKRCRGGKPQRRDVEWDHETGDFRMAAALAHRPAVPVADGAAEPGRAPQRLAG